jgi:hypothetical protein
MLTARFLAMPVIAVAVIGALAQAHSRPGASQTESPAIYRAVDCAALHASAASACALAGNAPAAVVR